MSNTDDYKMLFGYGAQAWPQPSEKERQLRELGEEYHRATENYDQLVCSARSPNGVAHPVNHEENRLIQQNAQAVRRSLIYRVMRLGLHISVSELDRAIQDAAPYER